MMKARHIECTNAEYHARRDEWCRSQVENMLPPEGSPPLFHGRHISGIYPRKRSKPLDGGTVTHALLSSPGAQHDVVAIIPPEALNEQGHRKGQAWKAYRAEHEGLILMTEEEFEPVKRMVRNVYDHPQAWRLLAGAMHHEFTILHHDDDSGLDLRTRPDLIASVGGRVFVPDFKTTKAMTPREFAADAVKYGYHRQAAWYIEAVEAYGYEVARKGFPFITVDKSPAHECRVYTLPERAIELGRQENRMNRRELARRLEEDDWTDPLGKEVHEVDLPEYAYSDPWRAMVP